MLFFFGPSLGPPAFASALPRQASGPRLGPQKSIFSAHFSLAAILILETQNIYLSDFIEMFLNMSLGSCKKSPFKKV